MTETIYPVSRKFCERTHEFYWSLQPDARTPEEAEQAWQEMSMPQRTAFMALIGFVFQKGIDHEAATRRARFVESVSPFAFAIGERVRVPGNSKTGRVVARFDCGDLAPPSYRVLGFDEFGDLSLDLESEATLRAVKPLPQSESDA